MHGRVQERFVLHEVVNYTLGTLRLGLLVVVVVHALVQLLVP